MKPIIITNPVSLPDEIQIIHQLLGDGLEMLHIRKPDYSETDYRSLLSCIHSYYRDKLVLHQFHSMAEEFGINRLHFTSENRKKTSDWEQYSDFILSTSVHSIEEFNELPSCFEYAFLSPVFPSISKVGYFSEKNLFEEVKKRTNFQTKLIALGGITLENGQWTMDNEFDGVAMLGAIWGIEGRWTRRKKED
jgi:thiamine-phosphate pyrophosphorylase